jgi:DNA-binding transcriptional MerR regulator
MLIGDFSRRSGVSVRMLRYYERQGLLRPARRTSGYRLYNDADLLTAKRIRALNTAGLKLGTIRKLLPCARDGSLEFEPCAEFHDSLRRQLVELDSRISELSNSRSTLAAYLGGG